MRTKIKHATPIRHSLGLLGFVLISPLIAAFIIPEDSLKFGMPWMPLLALLVVLLFVAGAVLILWWMLCGEMDNQAFAHPNGRKYHYLASCVPGSVKVSWDYVTGRSLGRCDHCCNN